MPLKKRIAISCIAAFLAGVIALTYCLVSTKNPSDDTTSSFVVTTITENGMSDLMNTTIFLGSSFTKGVRAEESFAQQLGADGFIRPVVYCEKGLRMVGGSSRSEDYITLLGKIPTVHAAPTVFMCEIPYADAEKGTKLGELSKGYSREALDIETVYGAMEYIAGYASDTWGCPVIFYTCNYCDSKKYERLITAAYEVSEKWNVNVLDLYSGMENRVSLEDKKKYFKRGYPTKEGYARLYTPKFREALSKYVRQENEK